MKKYIAAALMGILWICPAYAQEYTILPKGQTMIALSVTERVSVQQDTVHASLRVESENGDQVKVQDFINTAMKKAIDLAKQAKEVEISTGNYSVYENDDGGDSGDDAARAARKSWHGSQTLELEGKDAKQVLDLTGRLQAMGFVMNDLRYGLSVEAADEARDGLMEKAVKRAKAKAERAAKALGKSSVYLANVAIDASENGYAPPPMPMMMKAGMADTAEMTAPSAEGGMSQVTMTINVRAVAE